MKFIDLLRNDMKIIVIGNSGSGKTWLAKKLVAYSPAVLIHLDHFFWEPGGFDKKRNINEIRSLIESSKIASSWIAEGVFGDLAEKYIIDADMLIWLDLEWSVCQRRLRLRGSESKAHMNREQSAAELEKLIGWASDYDARGGMCSYQGHLKLFEQFHGVRIRLQSEAAVSEFISDLPVFCGKNPRD